MRKAIAAIVAWILLSAAVSAASVIAVWDPNPATDVVTGYRLKYGTAAGVYTMTVDTGGPVTILTVQNLTPGVRYFFVVTAYNATAESGPSAEVNYMVPVVDDCAFPLGAKAVSIFPTQLMLTGSKGAGSRARLDFQLGSSVPVVGVAVQTGGNALAAMTGTDLTALAGLWFTVPPMGTYPLSVFATNIAGCSRTQSTPYVLTVK